MTTDKTNEKYLELQKYIDKLGKVSIALSGGVDSSFLSKVFYDVLGDNAIAITIVSPLIPKSEVNDAVEISKLIGIKHILLEETDINNKISRNPTNRCYLCKKDEFSLIKTKSLELGFNFVLDGSNIDDINDYRPGLKALKELNIKSPLRDLGFTKEEIRNLSRKLNLKTWDKPAYACLASRIPYGDSITIEILERIEKAEAFLRAKGFRQLRVRDHKNIARIEVAKDERNLFFDTTLLDEISRVLKSYGFSFVAMDLEGYKTGCFNTNINSRGNNE